MKKIKKGKFKLQISSELVAYTKALRDLENANKAVVDANEHARKMSLAVRKAKANREGVPNG